MRGHYVFEFEAMGIEFIEFWPEGVFDEEVFIGRSQVVTDLFVLLSLENDVYVVVLVVVVGVLGLFYLDCFGE